MQNVKEFKAHVNKDREFRMYGCSISDFKESLEDSFTFKVSGPAMCAMSLMSDAQEILARDTDGTFSLYQGEEVRQTLNRAKWILSEYVMDTLKL